MYISFLIFLSGKNSNATSRFARKIYTLNICETIRESDYKLNILSFSFIVKDLIYLDALEILYFLNELAMGSFWRNAY